MMKRFTVKKWLACLLALCTLLALCACGGTSGGTEPVAAHKDPKSVIEEAAKKLNEAKSLSFDMEIELKMSYTGQSMDMTMAMSGESIVEPLISHANIRMEALGMDAEIYTVRQDDAFITYTGLKQGGKVVSWSKTSVSADDLDEIQSQLGAYDAQGNFTAQLDHIHELKEIGAETVNGKNATRYDGVIHGKDVGEVLGSTSLSETLDSFGIDPSRVDQDIPSSIWIYEDGTPARYSFDMTDMMTQLFAQNDQTAQMEISAVRMSMTITGVDTVSEIVIPQEALDAKEASEGNIPGGEENGPEETPSNGQDGVFTSNGMTITLNEDFTEESVPGFTSCYYSDDVAVLSLREPFTLMDGLEDYTAEEYGELALENNGISVSQLTAFNGIPGFEYDFTDPDSGDDYHYRIFLYKSDDAFWMVQFFTLKDSFAQYESQINQWAQTVTFEG